MITAEAPRGGVVETLDGTPRIFLLRLAEIERFEDKHRGIFELWDGFFRSGLKPNLNEVRDLLALGLVGAGMKDKEADAVIGGVGPDRLLDMYAIAQAVLGVALMPDVGNETSADRDTAPEKKSKRPKAASTSAK